MVEAPTPESHTDPTSNLWRGLGVTAVIGLVLFWIYAFANGSSVPHGDEFEDPVFQGAAEAICAEHQAAVSELAPAGSVETPQKRAELVDEATAELRAMVTKISMLDPPTDPKGASGVELWLADYETYLADRDTWSAKLHDGIDSPFVMRASSTGIRVTTLLRNFAEFNNMGSCVPSSDV